jgi:putative transposase
VKRNVLMEATGSPLAIVLAGANVHDTKLLAATLDGVVVERPQPTAEQPQHLSLNTAHDNPTGEAAVAAHGYVLHIRRTDEDMVDPATGEQRFPVRRWVVKTTLAQLSKCSAVLIRCVKQGANSRGCYSLLALSFGFSACSTWLF